MSIRLNTIDKVEILTLQDNYIDLLSNDTNEVVQRPVSLTSIVAEHGFSSVITVTNEKSEQSLLFDFGFSPNGAAYNADVLGVDYHRISSSVLSHGHVDHFGGMLALIKKLNRDSLDFVVHPAVFREKRCVKLPDGKKMEMPRFTREMAEEAGVNLVETKTPYALLDGDILFLGQIPRKTTFEKGVPNIIYNNNGQEMWDDIADDSAVVINVKDKGLVIISGCAHSGIINSINYAKEITGVDDIYAVMGGFHLTGPVMAPAVAPTIKELKNINPGYVIPTHCTGRDAIMQIEKEMPDNFILNMAGSKLVFSA